MLGVTLAGLAVVDPVEIAASVALPVLIVNRRAPRNERLPSALQVAPGLYVAAAGISVAEAACLVRQARRKSVLPEPLRIAHLTAAVFARGESRGRA